MADRGIWSGSKVFPLIQQVLDLSTSGKNVQFKGQYSKVFRRLNIQGKYGIIMLPKLNIYFKSYLTLVLLNPDIPCLYSVDPDQLASEENNWSGSALFAIKYVNLYQQYGSSNLIGWKLEKGVAS